MTSEYIAENKNTVALITAAGMSSRMGRFKPLLKIEGIPIIDRILATFRKAGVRLIVVVCGNNAQNLINHIAAPDVVCLFNPDYKMTGMFESAQIGMQYILDHSNRYSRMLFTPVDIPLFNKETVQTLLQCKGQIIKPVFNNRGGHPILFQTSLISDVLSYTGAGGLKGALQHTGISIKRVSVDDPYILYDADTPEDLEKLRSIITEK